MVTTQLHAWDYLRLMQYINIPRGEREKTRAAGAGKPRTLFSLSDDFGFIIVFSKNFAKKKLLRLNKDQKEVLKKWLKES